MFALRHFIDHVKLAKQDLYTCFVDLQKPSPGGLRYCSHDFLWGRLRQIGVRSRMLAAVQSLYVTGTLAMKIAGTAGGAAGLPAQSHIVGHFL